MKEHLNVSRDIIRQRELLEALHQTYYQQLEAAGVIARLVQAGVNCLDIATSACVRPYRCFFPDSKNGLATDLTAVEVGDPNEPEQRVVVLGYVTASGEAMSYGNFMPQDVELVESMLEGLCEDYNWGILPNLSPNYNAVW